MKNISIDIETFSDIDLNKCGVYKYAESPNFEILLFGYAVDGGKVQVIDLAQGEHIPQEIIDALTDEDLAYIGRFAATAASLSTEVSGGIPSIPEKDAVLKAM